MNRISLNTFIIGALVLWGLPGIFVAGWPAALYTALAILPLWLLRLRDAEVPADQPRALSSGTRVVLSGFAILYLIWDATLGRQWLQMNMFLFHGAAAARLVDQVVASVGQGGGVAYLLGMILTLYPFALIDAANGASRFGRWAMWTLAVAFLFYQAGSGRGLLLMGVMAIVMGRTSDWRRILIAGGAGLGIFSLASLFRGDYAAVQNPLLDGIAAPFFNLAMLLGAHCGHAPWYNFLSEFAKKFLPAFLVPKTIFSFNAEMSFCIDPGNPDLSNGVSVFTWLGEVFYYVPSVVTALLTGFILGSLTRVVDRLFIRYRMYSGRLMAGFLCILTARSRAQDLFSFLIAQVLFLIFVWPRLCYLLRDLRRLLPEPGVEVAAEAGKQ
ncbi:MAG: hypothetical protein WBD46_15675 [Acidobacteriaceae bacterium]